MELSFEKVLANNPDSKESSAKVAAIKAEVEKYNSNPGPRIESFMTRVAEDLWAIKSLKNIPSWSELQTIVKGKDS